MAMPSTSEINNTKIQWQGRSHTNIFIKCLHLLDLDLLQDWPGITEKTFSVKSVQQNIQHRIKSVEWSLYRLFQLYDPEETRNKLRPFFPPLTPLQSLNLRAALLRVLGDLKKNGVLGREITIRKTLLDECKGEKFEELLSAFAIVVLRKASNSLVGRKSSKAVTQPSDMVPQESLLPLVLAHRVHLQKNLRRRNALKAEVTDTVSEYMDVKSYLDEAKKRNANDVPPADKKRREDLRKLLFENWSGDTDWVGVLLNGGPIPEFNKAKMPSSKLRNIFEQLQSSNMGDDQSKSLIEDLALRIQGHQNRLENMKTFMESLSSRSTKRLTIAKPSDPPADVSRLFSMNKHQDLTPASNLPSMNTIEMIKPSYADMLESLRKDMIGNEGHASKSGLRKESNVFRSPGAVTGTTLETFISSSLTDLPYRHCDENSAYPVSIMTARPPPDTERSGSSMGQNSQGNVQSPGVEHFERRETWPISSEEVEKRPTSLKEMPKNWDENTAEISRVAPMSSSEPERTTRTSTSPDFVEDESPSQEDQSEEPKKSPEHFPTPLEPRGKGSLLERTRQSMSLLSHQPSTGNQRRKTRNSRDSHKFNINQFETPIRPVAKEQPWPLASGDSTPREVLFDEEADYASVFKSRPRIALSPVLSPVQSSFSLDGRLEQNFGEMSLQSPEDEGVETES